MYLTFAQLSALPAFTVLNVESSEEEIVWLGMDGGTAIVREGGKVNRYDSDYFTGHALLIFDQDGYIVPRSGIAAYIA